MDPPFPGNMIFWAACTILSNFYFQKKNQSNFLSPFLTSPVGMSGCFEYFFVSGQISPPPTNFFHFCLFWYFWMFHTVLRTFQILAKFPPPHKKTMLQAVCSSDYAHLLPASSTTNCGWSIMLTSILVFLCAECTKGDIAPLWIRSARISPLPLFRLLHK